MEFHEFRLLRFEAGARERSGTLQQNLILFELNNSNFCGEKMKKEGEEEDRCINSETAQFCFPQAAQIYEKFPKASDEFLLRKPLCFESFVGFISEAREFFVQKLVRDLISAFVSAAQEVENVGSV